jgi:type I restriction enzyme S subunit
MNVPALRFKEFNGDWITKALNEITGKIGDGLHSTPVYDENGQYYFVNGNNLTNSKIEISEVTKRLNGNEYSKHKIELTPQTILISINGTIGNLAFYNNEKVVLGKSACYLNLNQNENKYFVFNLLQTSKIKLHFDKELTGSTIKNLSLTTIKNTKAYFPTLPEQTKIANFLTAVDDKITLLTKKADLLSQYKKGVMQQIFSQELRFKDDDGQEFPEWEDGHLGDVFEYRNGKSFENEVIKNGEYFLITLNSIDIDGRLKPEHKRVAKTDSSLLKNDLIMVLSDVAHGNFLGLTDIIPSDRYVLNQRIGGLRAKKDINVRFASLYINFNQKYFKLHGQGSSQLNLSKGDVIDFILPRLHIKEQTKIATFLTAIDEKITNNQTQLNAVKQYKQGLLQQMFV